VEDSHVLNVEVWVARSNAARAEISRLDERAIRVEVVDDGVCILLLTSGKDHDLEVLIGGLQTLPSKRPDIDASEDGLRLFRKLDGNDHVRVIRVDVVDAMDQRLVEVEDDRLRFRRVIRLWQVNKEVLNVTERRLAKICHTDVEQGLHCLIEVDFLDVQGLFFTVLIFFTLFERLVSCSYRILVLLLMIRLVCALLLGNGGYHIL